MVPGGRAIDRCRPAFVHEITFAACADSVLVGERVPQAHQVHFARRTMPRPLTRI